MCKDPSMTRRALVAVTKARVAKEDENTLLNKLWNLPKQGIMVRNFTSNAATIWSSAVGNLHQDALKFVLNAAVDTLPHICGGKKTQINVPYAQQTLEPSPCVELVQSSSGVKKI